MEYHKLADKKVREIKKLKIEKNLRKLDYEMLKAKTVEKTNEEQQKLEKEWMLDRNKKNWIGTPTEQQELARRLVADPQMTKDRELLKIMTKQELELDLQIFEAQELLNNLRVFGGNL